MCIGNSHSWRNILAAASLAVLVACGDSNGGGNRSPLVPSGNGPGPSGATITIGTNGALSPSSASVSTGQSVTFVNNDTRPHEMASDPHPTHGSCPSIDAIGTIAAGQTRLTNSFTTAGSCSFHDHLNPDTAALKGTITIR